MTDRWTEAKRTSGMFNFSLQRMRGGLTTFLTLYALGVLVFVWQLMRPIDQLFVSSTDAIWSTVAIICIFGGGAVCWWIVRNQESSLKWGARFLLVICPWLLVALSSWNSIIERGAS